MGDNHSPMIALVIFYEEHLPEPKQHTLPGPEDWVLVRVQHLVPRSCAGWTGYAKSLRDEIRVLSAKLARGLAR